MSTPNPKPRKNGGKNLPKVVKGMPSLQDLMALAIKEKAVDQLEKLIALKDHEEAKTAKAQFYAALSAFQAKCPPIAKSVKVTTKKGNVWHYADLTDILSIVGPLLKDNGFSWRVDSTYNEVTKCIQATCHVYHIGGHSETGEPFSVPIDEDAYMNASQKFGSASSYAKRYAFCNAFGILTEDPDDDGQASGESAMSPTVLYARFEQVMAAVLRNAESILTVKHLIREGDISGAVQAMHEIDEEDRVLIWVAPKKGGPWTTQERTTMRGDEWSSLWRQMT